MAAAAAHPPAPLGREQAPRELPAPDPRGGVLLGAIVDSERMNSRTFIALDRDDLGHVGTDLRLQARIPLTPALLDILDQIAALPGMGDAEGVLVRGREAHLTRELANALATLNPRLADPFYIDAQLALVLPPRADIRALRREQLDDTEADEAEEAVALQAGALERAPDDAQGRPRVANPATGRALVRPRAVWEILRRYRINDGAPPKLPYLRFDHNAGMPEVEVNPNAVVDEPFFENCLHRVFVQRYNEEMKGSKKISDRMLLRHLTAEPTGETLVKTCQKYKIRCLLYDVTGRLVYNSDSDYAPTKGRRGFAGMLYANHIYPYVGDLRGRVSLELGGETDLPFYDDTRFGAPGQTNAFHQALTESQQKASALIMQRSTSPNFMYRSEERVAMQAFAYYPDPSETPQAIKDGTAMGVDMKKAYDSILMTISADTEKIPIFTVHDVVRECAADEEIRDERYYWVDEKTMDAWDRSPDPRLAARQNDILHGFELKYLLELGLVARAAVTHVKTASYLMDVRRVREIVKSACEETAVTEEQRKVCFPLYNGVLGKKFTAPKHMSFGGASDEDANLLKADRAPDTIFVSKTYDGVNSVSVKVCGKIYMHLNNRNIYNWVVARVNHEMTRFMTDIGTRHPEARVLKVKTDGILYDRPITYSEWEEIMSPERVKWHPGRYQAQPTYPARIAEKTHEEIAAWRDEHCRVISGPPGTGKTFKVNEEGGYDLAATTTNRCARNMSTTEVAGKTLYSTLKVFDPTEIHNVAKSIAGKTFWIDEYSMVSKAIWSFIFVVGQRSSIILTGDPNQIPPVREEIDYNADFMRILFEKQEVTVDNEFTRNGPDLIAFRNRILDSNDRDLLRHVRYLLRRDDTHAVEDPNHYDTHLCKTNGTARLVNAYIVKKRGLTWTFDPAAEMYQASAGVLLEAKVTKKRRMVYKQARYRLKTDVPADALANFEVKLDLLKQSMEVDEEVTLTRKDLIMFQLGYAITVHSSQGMTIKDPYVIWEFYKMLQGENRDSRIFYTAATRAERMQDLRFVEGATHPLIAAERLSREENRWREMERALRDMGGEDDEGTTYGHFEVAP